MKKQKERQPLLATEVDIATGLSDEQIAERRQKGYINSVKIGTSKSYFSIFIGNIFTFFNLICFLVFIWLITVIEDSNGVKNLTFMLIITANIVIGIAQEIRAKLTMDKLSLLSSPDVKALRNGEEVSIKLNEILLGEIIKLKTGAQVCSDSIIREGEVEVNEALLTGESQSIKKSVGDKLLSGSFIVSGSCVAEVDHIAEDNYIQKLAMDAKKFKKVDSELLHSLKLIFKIISIIIFPIAIGAFFTNWNDVLMGIAGEKGLAFKDTLFYAIGHLNKFTGAELYSAYKIAVTPTSTAIIGMIPAGLFLLTSVALAVGVVRLAKQKALVQQLYSIETLARVDMLCLDKTGTITDGTMSVRKIECAKIPEEEVKKIISSMQFALGESNQTADALIKYFGKEEYMEASSVIHFSSERKCTAVKFKNEALYVLGAPEYATDMLNKNIAQVIEENSKLGFRCLLLCKNGSAQDDIESIPDRNTPIAVVVIEDNIKSDAPEIINYFKENGVDVRVISGDNPVTVSEVARRVGITNADKYINLHNMTDEEIREVAMDYTVFGRVNPAQKKLLVQIFKEHKHTVAMTGDGINDILALKEANCSIAMANGAEATRNVAQIVLLDSNFASMPKVVGEGRRVVNNIERASSLFLTKTVFSILFQIILIFMGIEMPLEPIQLSFISFFSIGVPSFILALEPNNRKIEGRFIVNVGKRVIPAGLGVVVNVFLLMILSQVTGIVQIPLEQLNTAVLISIYLTFAIILFDVCKPFNGLRIIMYSIMFGLAFLCIIFMPMVNGVLDGKLNLFMLSSITDPTTIFMIMSLFLISIYTIKVATFITDQFKLNEQGKIYFDTEKLKKVKELFKKKNNI
ncbi:MAG: HAD-IC family P-type ATPase [Clostridia bacterium]|nr:HAD-IC family P-type ATPase [Clostridia bacterium]